MGWNWNTVATPQGTTAKIPTHTPTVPGTPPEKPLEITIPKPKEQAAQPTPTATPPSEGPSDVLQQTEAAVPEPKAFVPPTKKSWNWNTTSNEETFSEDRREHFSPDLGDIISGNVKNVWGEIVDDPTVLARATVQVPVGVLQAAKTAFDVAASAGGAGAAGAVPVHRPCGHLRPR